MSNINNSDNISYTTKAKNFIDSIPFCIKILLGSNLIFFCFCHFFISFSLAFANIPYYTILKFQIWRLLTSNFISTNFLNLIFVIFFWLPQSMNLERSIGTVRYMINFFVNSIFIQLLYDLFLLIFSIFNSSILLKKIYYDKKNNMEYIESDGLWPYIMMEMTILCLANPENEMNILCFSSPIKSKYYPLILFVILTVCNFTIKFDLIAGILYGCIYVYYLRNYLDFDEQTIEKIEGSFLFNYTKNYPSFVKKSNVDASLLLGNDMNNINNYNEINYNGMKELNTGKGNSTQI
jgi:hypothetical protein